MADQEGPDETEDTKELKLYPSRQVIAYLEELAGQGFKGTKVPRVAVALIGDRIEQLLKDGLLKLRKPRKLRGRVKRTGA
jgi:hypothetical protein